MSNNDEIASEADSYAHLRWQGLRHQVAAATQDGTPHALQSERHIHAGAGSERIMREGRTVILHSYVTERATFHQLKSDRYAYFFNLDDDSCVLVKHLCRLDPTDFYQNIFDF